ncbi:MAG: hypothetical protein CM15mV11_1330 [Caudoviricetes sp.]|nr:MAG: hypothetical protein CM15mV11_1330 [Caudoviricetes sp.]
MKIQESGFIFHYLRSKILTKLLLDTKIQEDLIQHFDDEYNKDLDPTENSDWRQHQIKEQKAAIDFSKDHYLKFKKSTGKTVNYLLKQFEMKKSADQYKRQATSKTGVINTQSLYK